MGRWGDGDIEKYLVMVEDGTFFYTELNGFDITRLFLRSHSSGRGTVGLATYRINSFDTIY
ncbi:hypothetical protein D5R40_04255 [Okeania hirsuta]|uniref:Uncharacterized protein n=1 Tax=Okeania hirsuta TaxID=1458930 RepID=A0A3N6N4G0_9CYAN|nr:hypothetical protein D4Z78_27400 [Okeania hirsuta]RQH53480.1 hypothetical protein D5R40_04255 [Okeania hirsuta]